MADAPIVSIIICSRNRAAGLGQTITTLNQINATHPWEALLIDNASTDDTPAVLQAAVQANPHLRSLLCPRIGLGAAREFARTHAKGRILAFTDDDCLIAPDYVDALVQAFDRHPDAAVLGGWIGLHNRDHLELTIDERTEVVRHEARSFIRAGAFHGANLAFRAEALSQAGGFDPNLGAGTPFPCEDIDAVARVVASGHAAVFDPQVKVDHNHGRTAVDWPRLMTAYMHGRGAYYAQRLADPITRAGCRAVWLSDAAEAIFWADVVFVWQEVVFANRYARGHLGLGQAVVVQVTTVRALAAASRGWLGHLLGRRLGLARGTPDAKEK